MTVYSPDWLRWRAERDAELARIRELHPQVEVFLGRLAALEREFGLTLETCCKLWVERDGHAVFDDLERAGDHYEGRFPE